MHGSMAGMSLSEPMMMPTTGLFCSQDIRSPSVALIGCTQCSEPKPAALSHNAPDHRFYVARPGQA